MSACRSISDIRQGAPTIVNERHRQSVRPDGRARRNPVNWFMGFSLINLALIKPPRWGMISRAWGAYGEV